MTDILTTHDHIGQHRMERNEEVNIRKVGQKDPKYHDDEKKMGKESSFVNISAGMSEVGIQIVEK